MIDPLLTASSLRKEADQVLQETGLLALLERYGTVSTTGSYSYDLMTWRDIDLCLALPTIETRSIFDLGREIAVLPGVGSMYYRNEFIMETPGNPRAVFWCVDFYLSSEIKWKVDILISTSEEVARVLQPGQGLKARLNHQKREAILQIKSVLCQRDCYRQEYGSRDVYDAVMEHEVKTIEEWDNWWKNQNT